MSTFAALAVKKPDPLKRVNYPFGLVLGVDEFVQEQAYLLEQDRGHNRQLHGYGTVWGLLVEVPEEVEPPEVRVSPGVAVAPAGMRICVPDAMCAKLDDWLEGRQAALGKLFGDPEFELKLCVVLCYRECHTDVVPLPGEPCRSEEETRGPSRIQDSFEVKLCVHEDAAVPVGSPPPGPEEVGLCSCPVHTAQAWGARAFAELLRRIVLGAPAGPYLSREDLEKEVREILRLDPSASTTVPGPELVVSSDEARAMLQAASRVWATEVLPELLTRDNQGSCGLPGGDVCVLLAELTIPVSADWKVKGGAKKVKVDDTMRPILLSTQVLQEWLLTGGPVDRS